MKIAIRADGNKRIGSGHVMRCLSIAKALRKRGEEVIFICADGSMNDIITRNDFEMYTLGTDFADMESELDMLCEMLKDLEVSKVLVDSYFTTDYYLSELDNRFEITMMDDYANHVYPVSKVINYNLYAGEEYASLYEGLPTRLALGADYAPLRDEFLAIRGVDNSDNRNAEKMTEISDEMGNESRNGNGIVGNACNEVLVLTGGADPEHVAIRISEKIMEDSMGCHFTIVAGALSDDIGKLREIEEKTDSLTVRVNVTDIQNLMAAADIAITAGGSTTYELCACKTPMITYILADNQEKIAKGMADAGAAVYAGDARQRSNNNSLDDILCGLDSKKESMDEINGSQDKDFTFYLWTNLRNLKSDVDKRSAMSKAASNLVDGKGAMRLAEFIMN